MNNYNEWDELDFLFNRAKLKEINPDVGISKRRMLIIELSEILKDIKVKYYLGGKTSFIFDENYYENIFEDNIVIFEESSKQLISNINKFIDKGFEVIKKNKNQIFLLKEKRVFKIDLSSDTLRDLKINLTEKKINNNILLVNKIISNKSKKNNKLSILKKQIKNFYLNMFRSAVTYKDFLNLEIESSNSKSWILRKTHLDLVTNKSQNKKVYQIRDYLIKKENFSKVNKNIIETDTSNIFEEPIYANKVFWTSGNNFFIYPIIFGFKKGVVPYKDVNEYIKNEGSPYIYTYEYYEKLETMTEVEIGQFLKSNPIEISNNAIVSGKHRAFAMIGRIINGKEYIKFRAKYV